ncbi:hypothetical protein EKK58_10880 [Candidatus Dependentiae bacterium]|nr:MAG: hypothetical protein EKK58_10880 [Candidatus Dependentiae bacterium]
MRSIISLWLLWCFILMPGSSNSIILIKSNQESTLSTFNFPVEKIKEDSNAYLLYTAAGAHQAGTAKNFSIACIDQTTGICTPLTPEKVTLNITQSNQDNPLYDNTYKDFAVMHIAGDSLPVVLTQNNNLNQVFMYESTFPSNISILQSSIINDAHAIPTAALNLSLLSTDNNGHIITCTTPNSGVFGDRGSGIALIVRGFKTENDVQVRAFQQINALTGNAADPAIAFPVDRTSQFFTFNNNSLIAITPTVFWWDDILQRWYIGITGTGNTSANDGIRTVCMARLSGHQLIIDELLPESAFNGTNNDLLIGKKGSNQQANVTDIITMHTSKNTAYLIVRGNQNTSNDIQAIKLVQSNDPTLHGKVADKNSSSQDLFAPTVGNIPVYQKTITPDPATTPSHLPTSTDPATVPGGGILLQGVVTSMKAVGDTLYVSTSNSNTAELNGMYQTTAIVEPVKGNIVGWTSWQPVLLQHTNVIFATVNRKTGNVNLLVNDSQGQPNTVLQTQWLQAKNNNCSIAPLNDLLQENKTSVLQKTVYIPATTPGINAGSLSMFLYQDKIIISFLTHTTADGIQEQTPSTAFTDVQNITNGTSNITFNANTLSIKKDELTTLGFPTCSCIAYSSPTNDAWFVVGGTDGIALLATPQGKGWSLTQGIGDNFSNLPATYTTLHTKKVKNVEQLCAVDGFLFILTDQQLLRMPLDPNILFNAPITIIADCSTQPFQYVQGFTNMLASGPLMLLGTTNGLWCNAPGSNSSTLDDTTQWEEIVLPESGPCMQDFTVVSKTGYQGDATNFQGGMVYVYSKDISAKAGRVHRLYLSPTAGTLVQQNDIQVFNDQRVEQVPSHLLDIGAACQATKNIGNTFFCLKNNTNIALATLAIIAPTNADGHNPYIGLTKWLIPLLLNSPVTGFYSIAGHGGILITDSQQLYVNQ